MSTPNPESQLPPADLYRPGLYNFSAVALHGLLKLAGDYDLEVWDKLEDDEAGILTGNHYGIMDIPLIGAATKHVYKENEDGKNPKSRNIRFLLKEDLVKNYRYHDLVALYFDMMGGITVDVLKPITEQPIPWSQLMRDIANKELICSFNQRGVMPGRRPRRIGPLAVMTGTAVQAVGLAGTEGNREAWTGPKAVVYGKVLKPELDGVSFEPENRRAWAKYTNSFSAEVESMVQSVDKRAHQMQSRKVVPISGLRS